MNQGSVLFLKIDHVSSSAIPNNIILVAPKIQGRNLIVIRVTNKLPIKTARDMMIEHIPELLTIPRLVPKIYTALSTVIKKASNL